MQNRKKTLTAVLAVVLISSLFGTTVLAAKPETPDPLSIIWNEINSIWDAITGLQNKDTELDTKLDSLETQIAACASTGGNLSFTAPDFGINYNQITNNFYYHETEGWLRAPVHLPQGAKITGIALIAKDKGPGGAVWTNHVSLLLRVLDYGSITGDEYLTSELVAELDSTVTPAGKYFDYYYGETDGYAKIFGWDVVDNNKSTYILYLWVPSDIDDPAYSFTFYSAFIEYEIPEI